MNLVKTSLANMLVSYLDKDPIGNTQKTIKVLTKLNVFAKNNNALDGIYKKLEDENSSWHGFVHNLSQNLESNVRKKFIRNFLMNAGVYTTSKRARLREKWNMNVPWAVLMDPTSSCNLRCIGCWATDYKKTDSLSFDVMDRIVREGKKMTVYYYLFSGGEPLMRKKDLIRLCEKHPDCYFSAFTNGTLVDDEFAGEMARVGNFSLALSIEGFEEKTDFRRGKGTFKKVIQAMDILHKHGILFGFSATYHRNNTDVMASDEFLDLMEEKGCVYGWYFTYMPVGSDAHKELVVTAEQREYMFHRLREVRQNRPMFLMDFWNDGPHCGGCIAGGRRYLHITANGAVEPCAFIHYSSANINDMSLKEAISQPLFKEYHKRQPFNRNLLRPCPCLDNPDELKEMVVQSGAKSTQVMDPETVECLTDKCRDHAKSWEPVADKLFYPDEEDASKTVKKTNHNGSKKDVVAGRKVEPKVEKVCEN